MTNTGLTFHKAITGHQKDVNWVSFSPDGQLIATASGDKSIRLWKATDFTEIPCSPLIAHTFAVNWVDFRRDGDQIASCSTDGRALLWDSKTGKQLQTISNGNQNSLRAGRFSPDGSELAIGGSDESLSIWNIDRGKLVRRYKGHEATVLALAWSPTGLFIVSGSANGDLRVWDSKYGHCKDLAYILDAHDLGVTCIEFFKKTDCPNVYKLATCGMDHLVKIWLFSAGPPGTTDVHFSNVVTLKGHEAAVMCVAWSPSGKVLASGGGDHTIRLWQVDKGYQITNILGHSRYVTCISFSPDGQLLASASNDRAVNIWGVNGKKEKLEKLEVSSVSKWSVQDVQRWLEENHLHNHVNVFVQEQITGDRLLSINAANLSENLNISSLSDRIKILSLLSDLKRSIPNRPDKGQKPNGLNIDEFLICPITMQLLKDPVIASDGYTYERDAMQQWLSTGHNRSPVTNEQLENTKLISNRLIKILLAEHVSNCK